MILVSDFETTTGNQRLEPKERETEVWISCFVDINKKDDLNSYVINTNISDYFVALFEYITANSEDAEIIIFFHNLKFDGSFIINFLMRNGIEFESFINDMGVWYSITIETDTFKIVFRDSLKILNFSIAKMAEIFKLKEPKGKTPLLEEKPKVILPEWNDYVKNDVVILATGIYNMYVVEKFKRFTSASEALHEFKDIIGKGEYRKKFPLLPKEIDGYIRLAYKGGWTYVNPKFQNKIIFDDIVVYDINSMYPSKMLYYPMPYGYPDFYDGEPPNDELYYVAKVWLNIDLKDGYLPTLQTKDPEILLKLDIKSTDYIKTTDKEMYCFYLTNYDMKLIYKHYNIKDIVFESYYQFRTVSHFFDDYIFKYKELKENAKTASEKQKAKIMLNALYGKFGSKILVREKNCHLVNGVNKFSNGDFQETDPNYVALSVFITSISRYDIISDAQKNYDSFIYADTDSLHLIKGNNDFDLDVDPNKFGCWKLESECIKGKYLRSKLYMEQFKDGTIAIKGAGMTDEIKSQVTFDNFTFGQEYTGKRASKQVKGGMIIYNTTFKIKDHDFFS